MKRLALAVAMMVASVVATQPAYAQGRPGADSLTIPVVGSNATGGAFNGTFELQRFATDAAGNLVAQGTLSGVVTQTVNGVTTVVGSITRNLAIPVVGTQATCDILHLDLGPLDLNLLGLQINLSRIVLDITAQAGAGNLLGNLLCAVANLLNGPGAGGGLANLLNQILAILG
jgi:hypothetical protein